MTNPDATGAGTVGGAGPQPAAGSLLSRRQFLWWSAVLGAGAAVPQLPRWLEGEQRPVGLGFIGLGERGAEALAACRGLAGVRLVALCDRNAEALHRAVALAGLAAEASRGPRAGILVTREPADLLRCSAVAAVVLAAAGAEQLALAEATCAAGRDLLVLRPLALDPAALRPLVALAGRRRLTVHVGRSWRYRAAGGQGRSLTALGEGGVTSALVQMRLLSPARPSAAMLAHDLLDEADFVESLLGGTIVRAVAVDGSGCFPGRWLDRRLHFDLAGAAGGRSAERRSLALALVADRGAAAAKAGQLVVRGSRGSAHLAAMRVAGCDALDLQIFLSAVRHRRSGPALTLPRLVHLLDTVLASALP